MTFPPPACELGADGSVGQYLQQETYLRYVNSAVGNDIGYGLFHLMMIHPY